MPRFEFNQDDVVDDWVDRGSHGLGLVVRAFGLVLLAVGFVVALMVISSAWSLYESPDKIESFARAVERGSNLDLTLSSTAAKGRRQLDASEAGTGSDAALLADSTAPAAQGLRFSYFVAWLIAMLMLMLIGRIAISAVRTGGELALYDVKVGKLARALLRERTRGS